MVKFLTFLREAFPPPQQKTGPPSGDQKSPFGNSAGPKKPKPSFGSQGTPKKPGGNGFKKPPFGPKATPKDDTENAPPFGQQNDEGDTPFGQQQEPMDAESMLAMQEIEQQKAEEEAALARARAEKEAIERQKVKNMRARADADVLAALENKYNDDTDVVEFYPDMLTFAQYNDEQREKEIKQRGKQEMSRGEGAAPNPAPNPTSSDLDISDHGETPKLPDADKSKEDLKKKKIRGIESDDTEALAQPPVSDTEEGGEEARDLQKEKDFNRGPDNVIKDPRQRKLFKIKPAEHISGNKFVGQDQFDDEMGEEGDEDAEDTELEDQGVGSGEGEGKKPPKPELVKGEDNEEDNESFAEKSKKLKKNKAKDPTIKKFSETGWQGQ